MRIKNFHSENLHIDDFHLADGEAWCVLGANNSGITSFIELFSENWQSITSLSSHENPTVVSFARLQQIFEEELKKDDTDFLNHIDPGTPARDFLLNPEKLAPLIKAFNLEKCLDKGFKQLSTGESRKLLLLSTFSQNPGIILLENPYDGLDKISCGELDLALQSLFLLGRKIIVTVNTINDIPPWSTHLVFLRDGHFFLQGRKEDILKQLAKISSSEKGEAFPIETFTKKREEEDTALITLNHGFAGYGDKPVFSGLNLRINTGQHTFITGPNGSGKSTLLQIITGDNPKCYANDLYIFGQKRGTGESIWDLKEKMGIVSPDLHRNHYIPGSALQVVVSGFFDSIGVYQRHTESQRRSAQQWLNATGLQSKSRLAFRTLPYAEQRLCLIARALIKMPLLLVLDEPTQGLDQGNRDNLLNFLESVAQKKLSTIIYTSHRSDEFRSFFQQHVDMICYNRKED